MANKEAARARVLYSNDPLQLSMSHAEEWKAPHEEKTSSESKLPELAKQGKWRDVAARTANLQDEPADRMLLTASWHVVAQVKLGNTANASQTLTISGDLDAPEYSQPTSEGTQSIVPFALRRAACEVQANLRPEEEQDALYSLLDFCQRQQPGNEGDTDLKHLWKIREECIMASIFCHHYRRREHTLALQWLQRLRLRHPDSLELLLTLGHFQLSLGQSQLATSTLQDAANMSLQQGKAETALRQIRYLKGMLLLAQNNLQGAASEFQAVLQEDPSDCVAVNNLAVCQMLSGKLVAGTKLLESSLQKFSRKLIQASVIKNLMIMYDLTGVPNSQQSKENVLQWLNHIGPHDLDMSAFS